mgnify:FL=1
MDNDGSPNGADASPSSPNSRPDGAPTHGAGGQPGQGGPRKRRRGSRGGKNHKKPQGEQARDGSAHDRNPQELPDPPAEGKISDPAEIGRAHV